MLKSLKVIQEYWGCHHGDGPTLKEAMEIAQVVADYMNSKGAKQ